MIVFLEMTFLSYFWHFKRNLFVFPAEFVSFNIPCRYCFLVGLFLKENFNSQVLNKTNNFTLQDSRSRTFLIYYKRWTLNPEKKPLF